MQVVAEDGTMTFEAVTSTIDFASYSPQPDSYDPESYYDAEEVLSNTDSNGVLEDMQKGFVGLALDVFAELDGATTTTAATEAESDATTTLSPETTAAVEERGLRGRSLNSVVRSLQDISFLIGGNLTTEVEDIGECYVHAHYLV